MTAAEQVVPLWSQLNCPVPFKVEDNVAENKIIKALGMRWEAKVWDGNKIVVV